MCYYRTYAQDPNLIIRSCRDCPFFEVSKPITLPATILYQQQSASYLIHRTPLSSCDALALLDSTAAQIILTTNQA